MKYLSYFTLILNMNNKFIYTVCSKDNIYSYINNFKGIKFVNINKIFIFKKLFWWIFTLGPLGNTGFLHSFSLFSDVFYANLTKKTITNFAKV